MSKKTYQLLLDKQRASRMTTHLRNMRLTYSASECGETICIQVECLDSQVKDIRACLDEVNNYYNIKVDVQETETEREMY